MKDWANGVAHTPYVGFSVMANLDISETGAIRMNNKPIASPTTTTGIIQWVTETDGNVVYALASDNKVYTVNTTDGTLTLVLGNTLGSPCGIGFWKGYIFVTRNVNNDIRIDVYDPNSNTWHNDWQITLGNSTYGNTPIVSGQDDILYIGHGRYIASIEENTGQTFDPTNGATYTYNGSALDLPSQYDISCMSEYGSNLMIGTRIITTANSADIFPWDRVSPSFDIPVKIGERGVFALRVMSNTLYAICGENATLYETNGTSATRIEAIGDLMRPLTNNFIPHWKPIQSTQVNPTVSMIDCNNKLLIGISTILSFDDGRYPVGVWSFDGKSFALENITTSGTNTLTNQNQFISALFTSPSYGYMYSWFDGTNHGFDLLQDGYPIGTFHSNYEPFFESPLYRIGTKLSPFTFQRIEVEFGKKLLSGEGIKILYRTALGDSWTDFKTVDYTTYGAINSIFFDFAVTTDLIQFRVEFTTNGTTNDSPELFEIRAI